MLLGGSRAPVRAALICRCSMATPRSVWTHSRLLSHFEKRLIVTQGQSPQAPSSSVCQVTAPHTDRQSALLEWTVRSLEDLLNSKAALTFPSVETSVLQVSRLIDHLWQPIRREGCVSQSSLLVGIHQLICVG